MPTPQERYDSLYPMTPMDPMAQPKPTHWLVPGLLMERKINGWFGFEKAGKSRLLGWLLTHMYQNQKVLDEVSKTPGRTMYLAGEEQPHDVVERLRHYTRLASLDFKAVPWQDTITFCSATGMRMERQDQRTWLRDRLVRDNYTCLIIDPLRRIHGAAENSNDEMAPLLNDIRDWSNKLGITVILLHHTGKLGLDDDESRIATWSRGATDLPAVLDWAVYLRRRAPGRDGRFQGFVDLRTAGRATPREPLVVVDKGDVGGWVAVTE